VQQDYERAFFWAARHGVQANAVALEPQVLE